MGIGHGPAIIVVAPGAGAVGHGPAATDTIPASVLPDEATRTDAEVASAASPCVEVEDETVTGVVRTTYHATGTCIVSAPASASAGDWIAGEHAATGATLTICGETIPDTGGYVHYIGGAWRLGGEAPA